MLRRAGILGSTMIRRVFKPLNVTVAVLLAVGLGGALVWRAGGEVRERDLAAYRAFEAEVLPAVDRAEQLARALPDGDLVAAERTVSAARALLARNVSQAEVLTPTVTWFASAFVAAEEAIASLRGGRDPAVLLDDMRAAFGTARENLEMLRARLRLQPL